MPSINLGLENYTNFSLSEKRQEIIKEFLNKDVSGSDNSDFKAEFRVTIIEMGLLDTFFDWAFHHGAKKEALKNFANLIAGDNEEDRKNAFMWLMDKMTSTAINELDVTVSRSGFSFCFSKTFSIENIDLNIKEIDTIFRKHPSLYKRSNVENHYVDKYLEDESNLVRINTLHNNSELELFSFDFNENEKYPILSYTNKQVLIIEHSLGKDIMNAFCHGIANKKNIYIECIGSRHTIDNEGNVKAELVIFRKDEFKKIMGIDFDFDRFNDDSRVVVTVPMLTKDKSVGAFNYIFSQLNIIDQYATLAKNISLDISVYLNNPHDYKVLIDCYNSYFEEKGGLKIIGYIKHNKHNDYNIAIFCGCDNHGASVTLTLFAKAIEESYIQDFNNHLNSKDSLKNKQHSGYIIASILSAEQVFDSIILNEEKENYNLKGNKISPSNLSVMLAEELIKKGKCKLTLKDSVFRVSIGKHRFNIAAKMEKGEAVNSRSCSTGEARGGLILSAAKLTKFNLYKHDEDIDKNSSGYIEFLKKSGANNLNACCYFDLESIIEAINNRPRAFIENSH